MAATETSRQAFKKAKKRGTLARNKKMMLKAVLEYRNENNEWPTAKQAFRHLAQTRSNVDPLNKSSYQPRLTNDLPEMNMAEQAGIRNDRKTWKPTQIGLQALQKAEQTAR